MSEEIKDEKSIVESDVEKITEELENNGIKKLDTPFSIDKNGTPILPQNRSQRRAMERRIRRKKSGRR